MDGSPSRGETIPIRLFLGGFDLTPTFREVNKKYSTRYYLSLVLIDEGKLPVNLTGSTEVTDFIQTHEDISSNPKSFFTANNPKLLQQRANRHRSLARHRQSGHRQRDQTL
jgi:hypothetical protein